MDPVSTLAQRFAEELPQIEARFEEPLSRHTSFRIGGPCEIFALPKSPEELGKILHFCEKQGIPAKILGAGTNVLAPDEGVRGVVVCLKDALAGMERTGDTQVRLFAGVTMTRAAVWAAGLGLSGLEFAHGIPGTVGGGVFMNAGAYGGEIKDVCTAVEVMDRHGNVKILTGEEMAFSYRHSRLCAGEEIVIWAEFALRPAPVEEIRETMRALMARRSASQPLDFPSAGSAFKRPAGGYAAALIDDAGLRGFRVGDAAVSQKHCGFAVNLGHASAQEVRELLRQVSDRVYAHSGIRLEPEVRIW